MPPIGEGSLLPNIEMFGRGVVRREKKGLSIQAHSGPVRSRTLASRHGVVVARWLIARAVRTSTRMRGVEGTSKPLESMLESHLQAALSSAPLSQIQRKHEKLLN